MPDLARLKDEHVFQSYGEVRATNATRRTYRGLPINIVELKLMSPDENQKSPRFRWPADRHRPAPRHLGATTAALSGRCSAHQRRRRQAACRDRRTGL